MKTFLPLSQTLGTRLIAFFEKSRLLTMLLTAAFWVFIPLVSLAQPANDNCASASAVTIGGGGFGLGLFTSTQFDLSAATLQTGETFAPSIIVSGQNKKSIWYKFSLPTTRALRVSLAQPGNTIQAGNVGFAVYKANTCLPDNDSISLKLSPIETFGSSFHPCVETGDYLVQVSSNSAANGPVFITVDVSDTTGAAYDKPAGAYQFGKLTNLVTAIDFEVQCQSIDYAAEVCLPNSSFKDFTKSTWHTFTTPDYFDYLAVLLGDVHNSNGEEYTVGYRLYEGDATSTPVASLTQLGGCDSLRTNGYFPDRKVYKCGVLKTNTTYTVQLLYHKDFIRTMRLAVAYDGSAPTNGPQPISSLTAPNAMGVLNADANGINNPAYDVLACNSRHSNYSCPKSMPMVGVYPDGVTGPYNLSSFFSFNLATTSSITISTNIVCANNLMLRLYKQSLTGNCAGLDTVNIIGTGVQQMGFNCLEPGNYVLQVSGIDSIGVKENIYYWSIGTQNYPLCLFSHLGRDFSVGIVVKTQHTSNLFSLEAAGRVDKLNTNGAGVMQPLLLANPYTAVADTFGCANTVLPDNGLCGNDTTKAVFREFVVNDSLMVGFTSMSGQLSKLYKGDASALAIAQNKFSYPNRLTGLVPFSKCLYSWNCDIDRNACVVPGTYTLTSVGSEANLGQQVYSTITVTKPVTQHFTPATAQDLGSLWDSASTYSTLSFGSDVDIFTCRDNPATIGGFEPCELNGQKATKLIYRQFYLSKPALITIANVPDYYGCTYRGVMTLFTGRATSGLAGLKPVGGQWSCFASASLSGACEPMPAGWYTVVSYGYGPGFGNPLQGMDNSEYQGSWLGSYNAFNITITEACEGPQFNRPYKASVDTTTKKPYLIEWKKADDYNAAYPVTAKTYPLNIEHFNCTVDTPFAAKSCNDSYTKVAYYVFTTTQEAYVKINTGNSELWGSVYSFDVRSQDSTRLNNGTDTALQPCLRKEGRIEICRMKPDTYTLVLFAPPTWNCNSTTPSIYIDSVGYSRFDHAAKAYDFGDIKPDSIWYNGKRGDINPLNNGRAASNDFFYCTTGTQEKDPAEGASCYVQHNPLIYPAKINNVLHPNNDNIYDYTVDRRNLWYTFVVNHPGTVNVSVIGRKGESAFGTDYAVYKSDVDASIPFANLSASGELDSTLTQGLTFVGRNYNYYCYSIDPNINFYNEPCSFTPVRYFILVDKRFDYDLNSQVEVSVLLDSISAKQPKFDHYSQADDLGQVNNGVKKGGTDNFTCATRDNPDPVQSWDCRKTLWYKFTTQTTGNIAYRVVTNRAGRENLNGDYHIQLFKQNIPGDSTSAGLEFLPATSGFYDANGFPWGTRCISPGTYYILLPGCDAINEDIYPEIEITPQDGDFCSAPLVASLNGPGSSIIPVKIDCHTIGTDYGEFNPTLTCPAGAQTNQYKTSWYRLDIKGTDTLDVTVFIDEKTNAGSTEIKYRMMTGNCGAMQEQSCVQDALTRNTYKCLAPNNSYYIQVFTPLVSVNGQVVNGDIELNTSAVIHADECLPGNNCIAVANFTPQFDCTTDRDALFTNFSTYGTDITYKWDFGYNGKTSTDVSPRFFYPALTNDVTYTVTLEVTNTACGKKDNVSHTILIKARPAVNLGRDTVICLAGSSIAFDATSHVGSTYYWSNGVADSATSFASSGEHYVEVTYNECKARDSIKVWINPIAKQALQTLALCDVAQLTLSANRGQGEQYTWSTGAVDNNIVVNKPGYYWCDLYLNGCIVRDSFLVVSADLQPLGRDTSVCQANMPFTANATVNGASSYAWQDGAGNAEFSITEPGLYWVDINLSGCAFRDTLNLTVDSFKTAEINANICEGKFYTLPSGKKVLLTGIYYDSIKNTRGCDSLITTVNLVVDTVIRNNISTSICAGQTYTLPSGTQVSAQKIYNDTLRYDAGCDSLITVVDLKIGTPVIQDTTATRCLGESFVLPSGQIVNSTGFYQDTVKAALGCDSLITRLTLTVDSLVKVDVDASICTGLSYTLPSGSKVDQEGIYIDTLRNIRGCDSLITTTNLSVGKPLQEIFTTHICAGKDYQLPSGSLVSLAGTYIDTVRTSNGCDSLVSEITLVVDSPQSFSTQAFACEGQSYILPSGRLVTIAGIYLDTLRNINGCDSLLYTIDLQIASPVISDTAASRCAGETFVLPSGTIADKTGFYQDTLKTTLGCDSVITRLTLTIDLLERASIDTSICTGVNYTLPTGISVDKAGIYTDTLRNIRGCDSLIITTNLSVAKPLQETFTTHICAGQNYQLPSGGLVSLAGIYVDTVRTSNGCDSLVSEITLVVDSPQSFSTQAFACEGQSYSLPSGRQVAIAGIYLDTLRNINGCDSLLYTIDLQIVSPVISDTVASRCAGETFVLPSGTIADKTGYYQDTLKTTLGCDSIITRLTLTVDLLERVSVDARICTGLSYILPAGESVDKAGIYTDTLRNIRGCDSLITTTTLSVTAPLQEARNVTICLGQDYLLPSGRLVNIVGEYADTLRTAIGCDSLYTTITLVVESPISEQLDAFTCAGKSYTLPSGRLVSAAGIYQDTLRNIRGCDSVLYSINLAVYESRQVVVDAFICSGQRYIFPSGKQVNTAGGYADTLRTVNGCDSIVYQINLAVFTPVTASVIASVCEGNSYTLPSGRLVSAAGTYADTLHYANGCDSVVYNVSLSVLSAQSANITAQICEGQNYALPSGRQVGTEGVYNDTLRSTIGCDSLVYTINLSVKAPVRQSVDAVVCTGQSYVLPSGRAVSEAGVYRDTIRTTAGCDSILYTVQLRVNSILRETRIAAVCPGESFALPSGRPVSISGNYTDTLRYTNGCDSIIYAIAFTVRPQLSTTVQQSLCVGQSYTLPGGRVVLAAGTYIDTLTSLSTGCDSIVTTQLTARPPLTVSLTGPAVVCAGASATLMATATGGNGGPYMYTWQGANGTGSQVNVSPTADTKYVVTVSDGCTVLSAKDSVLISLSRPFTITASPDTSVCAGASAQLTASGAVRYQWSGAGINQLNVASPTATPTTTTTYTVVGFGADQCFTDTASITVTVVPLPTVTAGRDTTIMVGVSFPLRPAYSADITQYKWSPSDYLGCTNCPNPVTTPLKGVLYTITVTNSLGCTASDEQQISLVCNSEGVFIPNTFTPNGDGVNDVFYPRGQGIRAVRYLRIFNRWGQLVFERTNFNTDDRSAGWDGTYKGQKLAGDVFVYSAQAVCDNGQAVELKGTVMIVR
jgi:gliding motility-associated-like protein